MKLYSPKSTNSNTLNHITGIKKPLFIIVFDKKAEAKDFLSDVVKHISNDDTLKSYTLQIKFTGCSPEELTEDYIPFFSKQGSTISFKCPPEVPRNLSPMFMIDKPISDKTHDELTYAPKQIVRIFSLFCVMQYQEESYGSLMDFKCDIKDYIYPFSNCELSIENLMLLTEDFMHLAKMGYYKDCSHPPLMFNISKYEPTTDGKKTNVLYLPASNGYLIYPLRDDSNPLSGNGGFDDYNEKHINDNDTVENEDCKINDLDSLLSIHSTLKDSKVYKEELETILIRKIKNMIV